MHKDIEVAYDYGNQVSVKVPIEGKSECVDQALLRGDLDYLFASTRSIPSLIQPGHGSRT